MKKTIKQFAIFAVVMGVATVVGTDAFAAVPAGSGAGSGSGGNLGGGYESGKSLYDDLVGNLTGTTGTTIGLLISLVGLYMWIWNQVSWGIFVAIGGALMTAFPGIYTNLAGGAKEAFTETTSN
jgi:hypothetical protein